MEKKEVIKTFDTIIDILQSECEQHSNCNKCFYCNVCEDLNEYPQEILERLKVYCEANN